MFVGLSLSKYFFVSYAVLIWVSLLDLLLVGERSMDSWIPIPVPTGTATKSPEVEKVSVCRTADVIS